VCVVRSQAAAADKCGGRADGFGHYSYRAPPACLLRQLARRLPASSVHSPQVGWALDGFPVFGPLGPKV
jgi:hypothetical protein